VRSLPIILFIDDFGVHRNMYRAIKAFYWIPANLPYAERRKIANVFTYCLGPQRANVEDIVHNLRPGMAQMLEGMANDLMSLNFENTDSDNNLMAQVAVLESRYLGECMVVLWHYVLAVFGYMRFTYSDNGSHFVKGMIIQTLNQKAIRHVKAPITHPQSVGLSESSVRLVLGQLGKTLTNHFGFDFSSGDCMWH
jgi:hypothetical protein